MSEIETSAEIEVSAELLAKFKVSIGDFGTSNLNDYYINFLKSAKADLMTDDIDDAVLNTELGMATTILYAEQLMNKTDIATNPTITLLRNKLSLITKGARHVHE